MAYLLCGLAKVLSWGRVAPLCWGGQGEKAYAPGAPCLTPLPAAWDPV